MDKLKVVTLFSGIGAPEAALKRLKIPYEVVAFCEIDKYASQAYKAIHGEDLINLGDITKVDFTQEFLQNIDLLVGGFPCQTFSVAGKRAGFDDLRGTMCFHMARAIRDIKPKYFLFENVVGLLSHDKGKTIRIILEVFSSLGYEITMDMLNAKDYGIPQNRQRIFCIGRLIKDNQQETNIYNKPIHKRCKEIIEELESQCKIKVLKDFTFPKPIPLKKRLKDVLEEHVDEKYYLSDKIVERFKFKLSGDIVKVLRTTQPECRTIGQRDLVCDTEGAMDCLTATDYKQPKQIAEPFIAASRGRNPENPSDRTVGSPTEQRLEPNSQGISNTLTTVSKDNYVVEPSLEQVGGIGEKKFGNQYRQDDRVYDSNGLAAPLTAAESLGNTGRQTSLYMVESTDKDGFIGEKYKNFYEQYGYIPEIFNAYNTAEIKDIAPTLTTACGDGGLEPKIVEDYTIIGSTQKNAAVSYNGIAPMHNYDFRIRKLTPRECWRLMAFTDEEFDKAQGAGLSNTQLYKTAGNSIVVNCLVAIFFNLFFNKETKSWDY